MVIVGAIAAALAALMHVLIFLMESVWWRRERVWRRFGLRTQEQADTTQPLAYNQGFYNLFLAIGVAIGLILWCAGGSDASATAAGKTLVLFSLGSMVAAAIVLTTTGRGYLRAALTQGTIPLLAFVLVALG